MPYTQETLVCQNDMGGDLLDNEDMSADFDDLPHGEQVQQIMDKYFVNYTRAMPDKVNIKGYTFNIDNDVEDEDNILVKADSAFDEKTVSDLQLRNSSLTIAGNFKIQSLDGAPEKLKNLTLQYLKNLQSFGTFRQASDTLEVQACPKLLDFS